MSNKLFLVAAVFLTAIIAYQLSALTEKSRQSEVAEKARVRVHVLAISPKIEKQKIAETLKSETAKPETVKTLPKPEAEVAAPSKVVKMKVTAYCLCSECCGKWSGGNKTSIGDKANIYDGVAADPKLLPYRTKLNIPGIGIKEVDDTGGGMRQSAKQGIYHVDVRMSSHSEARKWEVRWLEVEVLGKAQDKKPTNGKMRS